MRSALALSLATAALAACGASTTPVPPPGTARGPSAFANDMLDAHNAVRASAQPVPQVPLLPLLWSGVAQSYARQWASGCTYAHDPELRARQLGQNIAATFPAGGTSAEQVVGLWAAEASDYDYATNACAPGRECGHYTQIVWRDTDALGCAHAVCPAEQWPFQTGTPADWDFWVCDYDPPGNTGVRPY